MFVFSFLDNLHASLAILRETLSPWKLWTCISWITLIWRKCYSLFYSCYKVVVFIIWAKCFIKFLCSFLYKLLFKSGISLSLIFSGIEKIVIIRQKIFIWHNFLLFLSHFYKRLDFLHTCLDSHIFMIKTLRRSTCD